MSSTFVLFSVIFGQVLLLTLNGAEGRRTYEIGQRHDGDHLVLKDKLSSRPAGSNEPPKVAFTYNITEAITYIEFSTEEVSLSSSLFNIRIFRDPQNRNKNLLFSSPRKTENKNKNKPAQTYRYSDIHLYLFIYI